MADAATISITATMLPDEIAKTFSGSMIVTPDDANDKWYYKLTSVTTTSAILIAGNYISQTAIAVGTGMTAVHGNDKVKFLFVQNTSTTDGMYMSFDNATAVNSGADNVFVGPSQTWFGRMPNTIVTNLLAISSDIADVGEGSISVIVAALLDDVA